MTRELESQLKQLFAAADVDLPAEDFTAGIMAELQRSYRRERLIRLSALVAPLLFLWLSWPSLGPMLRIAAEYASLLTEVAAESAVALSQSPLVYVYGTALGGYLLLRLVHRFQIRLM